MIYFYQNYFSDDLYLQYLSFCISKIIPIIPFLIGKIYSKFKKTSNLVKIINQTKPAKEDYLIFILMQIIDFLNILAYFTMDDDTYYFSRNFIFRYTFQFILFGLLTYFILKAN